MIMNHCNVKAIDHTLEYLTHIIWLLQYQMNVISVSESLHMAKHYQLCQFHGAFPQTLSIHM